MLAILAGRIQGRVLGLGRLSPPVPTTAIAAHSAVLGAAATRYMCLDSLHTASKTLPMTSALIKAMVSTGQEPAPHISCPKNTQHGSAPSSSPKLAQQQGDRTRGPLPRDIDIPAPKPDMGTPLPPDDMPPMSDVPHRIPPQPDMPNPLPRSPEEEVEMPHWPVGPGTERGGVPGPGWPDETLPDSNQPAIPQVSNRMAPSSLLDFTDTLMGHRGRAMLRGSGAGTRRGHGITPGRTGIAVHADACTVMSRGISVSSYPHWQRNCIG